MLVTNINTLSRAVGMAQTVFCLLDEWGVQTTAAVGKIKNKTEYTIENMKRE